MANGTADTLCHHLKNIWRVKAILETISLNVEQQRLPSASLVKSALTDLETGLELIELTINFLTNPDWIQIADSVLATRFPTGCNPKESLATVRELVNERRKANATR